MLNLHLVKVDKCAVLLELLLKFLVEKVNIQFYVWLLAKLEKFLVHAVQLLVQLVMKIGT